jgi:hypothetical protein
MDAFEAVFGELTNTSNLEDLEYDGVDIVLIPPCFQLRGMDDEEEGSMQSGGTMEVIQPGLSKVEDEGTSDIDLRPFQKCACHDVEFAPLLTAAPHIRTRPLSCASLQLVKTYIVSVCVLFLAAIVAAYVYMKKTKKQRKKQKNNDTNKKAFLMYKEVLQMLKQESLLPPGGPGRYETGCGQNSETIKYMALVHIRNDFIEKHFPAFEERTFAKEVLWPKVEKYLVDDGRLQITSKIIAGREFKAIAYFPPKVPVDTPSMSRTPSAPNPSYSGRMIVGRGDVAFT